MKRRTRSVALGAGLVLALLVVGRLVVSWLLGGSSSKKKESTGWVDAVIPTDVQDAIEAGWGAYTDSLKDFWGGVWETTGSWAKSWIPVISYAEPLPAGVDSDPISDPYGESRER